jgi:hypothetical protein
LRVASFKTDRSPDAARPHCLRRDDDAAQQRHAATVQRVGFDRVDFPFRPPVPENFAADAEQQAAEQRDRNCQDRIEGESRREAFAGLQVK